MSINYSGGAPVNSATLAHGDTVLDRPSEARDSLIPTADPAPAAAPKRIILPGLIVLDRSTSMSHVIESANDSIQKFADSLRGLPTVASQAHLGLLSFGSDATLELPLSRIADPGVQIPRVAARGGTNYRAAFEMALEVFRNELPQFKHDDDGAPLDLKRPAMYVVTDGQPNVEDWLPALQELRTRKWCPTIFAFGFGDADRDVIRTVADEGRAYFAADGQSPHEVFDAIIQVILKSTVTLSQLSVVAAANPAAPTPVLPMINPKLDPATAALDSISTID